MSERAFKKLLLKSQLLALEEQECEELDLLYAKEFAKDFKEELLLIATKADPPKDEEVFTVPRKVLKKLHRKLAMATHPDVSDNSGSFVEAQAAYEKGDAGHLLSMVADLKIEVSLDEKEMLDLAKQLRDKRARIDSLKQTVRWVWCNSDKSELLRSKIRKALGVSDEMWEKNKN